MWRERCMYVPGGQKCDRCKWGCAYYIARASNHNYGQGGEAATKMILILAVSGSVVCLMPVIEFGAKSRLDVVMG